MTAAVASAHQLDTLCLYGALMDGALMDGALMDSALMDGPMKNWAGRLVLACGPGSAASGISPAVSIAGGASLAIEADAAAVKAAMRLGEMDFVVNTLDEALRTLKNEIRQHRPLSVGLIADVDSALAEVVERGVQPDLLLVGSNQPAQQIVRNASICALEERGMAIREMSGEASSFSPFATRAVYLAAASAADLKLLDERVQAILPAGDLVRRRWMQQVPRYLREARSGGRWTWLSREEEQLLGL
jgi:hypothetical protein